MTPQKTLARLRRAGYKAGGLIRFKDPNTAKTTRSCKDSPTSKGDPERGWGPALVRGRLDAHTRKR